MFSWLTNIPSELATFVLAMLPIFELRGALPIALEVYHLPPGSAFLWSVLGNIFPIIFILYFLDVVSSFLSQRFSFFKKFFTWLFERTRRNHNGRFEKWGSLALITFVAIPLPLTGAWTGAVAAFVFGIPTKRALILISLGVIIAGVIVTLITKGIIQLPSFLASLIK